jgi:hypothetical protein
LFELLQAFLSCREKFCYKKECFSAAYVIWTLNQIKSCISFFSVQYSSINFLLHYLWLTNNFKIVIHEELRFGYKTRYSRGRRLKKKKRYIFYFLGDINGASRKNLRFRVHWVEILLSWTETTSLRQVSTKQSRSSVQNQKLTPMIHILPAWFALPTPL